MKTAKTKKPTKTKVTGLTLREFLNLMDEVLVAVNTNPDRYHLDSEVIVLTGDVDDRHYFSRGAALLHGRLFLHADR
jgi:hypothetical protein